VTLGNGNPFRAPLQERGSSVLPRCILLIAGNTVIMFGKAEVYKFGSLQWPYNQRV